MAKHLIAAIGVVNETRGGINYELKIENLPNKKIADAVAQAMGPAVIEVLRVIMGEPEDIGVNSNIDQSVVEAIKESTGKEVSQTQTLEGFLAKVGASPELIQQVSDAVANIGKVEVDDCQCPNCIARRAAEARDAQREAGSKSDAKH